MAVPIRSISMHACYNDDTFDSRVVAHANFRQLCDDWDEKEAPLPKHEDSAQQKTAMRTYNILQNLHRCVTEQTSQQQEHCRKSTTLQYSDKSYEMK